MPLVIPAIDKAFHRANRQPKALAGSYAFMALLLVLIHTDVLPVPKAPMTLTIVLFGFAGFATSFAFHRWGFESNLYRLGNLLEAAVFPAGLAVSMAQAGDGLLVLWTFYLLLSVVQSQYLGPSRIGLTLVLAPAVVLLVTEIAAGEVGTARFALTVSGLMLSGGLFLFFGATRRAQLDLAARHVETERELAVAQMKLEAQERLRGLEENWLKILENMTSALLLVDSSLGVVAVRGSKASRLEVDALVEAGFLESIRSYFIEAETTGMPVALFGRSLPNDAGYADVRIVWLPLGQLEERFAVLVQDVTERVLMEQTSQKMAQQMLVADKLNSVGILAAGIAHEVNNPLAYVMGNVEFLLTSESLSEGARAALRDADEGLRQITSIMGDLKGFSFSASATYRQTVDLREIVQRSCRLVRTELRQHARLIERIPDEPVFVRCQPERVQQVIVNLLVNAAQAFGGRAASENSVTIELTANEQKASVQVSDNGVGMSPDLQRKVFDLFFTTKAPGTGTGLGLSIAYNIAREHEGGLLVDSNEGVGSTFAFWIPRSAAPEAQIPILIVDDEERALQLYSRALANFQVTTATSVSAALDLLGRSFYVVLCDIRLPDGSGFDLYERAPASLQERFLFFTGLPPDMPDLLAGPANVRILHKPINLKTLEEELHAVARRVKC